MLLINNIDITEFAVASDRHCDNICVTFNGKEGINFMWELEEQKNSSETASIVGDNITATYTVKLSGITDNVINFIILDTSIEVTE